MIDPQSNLLACLADLSGVNDPPRTVRKAAEVICDALLPCSVSVVADWSPFGVESISIDLPAGHEPPSQFRHRLAGHAANSGTFQTRTEDGYSGAAAPLNVEGKIVGAIAIARDGSQPPFTVTDRSFLTAMTAMLSNTLARMAKAFALECEIRIRDHQEADMRAEVQRWVDILHNTGDIIQAVDADGHFLFCNQTWYEVLGYSYEQCLAMSAVDVIHPDCREHCAGLMAELRCGHSPGLVETQFITASGETIPVEGRIRIICEDGRFIHTVGIFRDMTERMRMERELSDTRERAKYLEGIHQAAITFQHEINNPLTALLGHAELMEMAGGKLDAGSDGSDGHLQAITQLGNRIAAVVKQMRNLYDPVVCCHPTSLESSATMIDLHQSG